ncbi:conserved hypothetical protein, partial [Ricinus communis]
MGQRRQWRQRVIQFVADDADDLLPRLHLLPAQFHRQLAQQQQLVLAAVQLEAAAREVVDVFLVDVGVGGPRGEQAVAAARQRVQQRRRGVGQNLAELVSFQPAALIQQLARGDVGIGDRPGLADQQHGHRRVLHHGVQQQLALDQVEALLAQYRAECIVGGHQVAQLIVLRPVQAEGKVAVLVAGDGAGQRAEQRQHALQLRADGDDGDRQHAQQADRQHQAGMVGEHARQFQRDQDANGKQRADERRPAREQRQAQTALAWRRHHGRTMPSRSMRRYSAWRDRP